MKFRNTVMSILLLIFLVSVVISFSYNKREISAGGYGVSNPIMKNGNTTWDCVYFGLQAETHRLHSQIKLST